VDLRCTRGFTLTELLVASLLFLIVLSGIYAFFRGQLYAIKSEEARLGTVEGARVGLDFMTREIRNAGYNPNGATCTGILLAQSQRIQIKSDLNENGNCLDANEDVTYAYDSGQEQITRDTGGGGQPLVEKVPSSGFSLSYFRSNGTAIPMSGNPPAVASADLPLIRGIKILIGPEVKHPDPWIGGKISTTLTTYVNRRNP
jgi:prepilin-type N-terminal cleavage/methylation domain-containing protein